MEMEMEDGRGCGTLKMNGRINQTHKAPTAAAYLHNTADQQRQVKHR